MIHLAQFGARHPEVCSWQSLGDKKKERHHSGATEGLCQMLEFGEKENNWSTNAHCRVKPEPSGQCQCPSCCSSGKSTGPWSVPSCTLINLGCQGHGDAGWQEIMPLREPSSSQKLKVVHVRMSAWTSLFRGYIHTYCSVFPSGSRKEEQESLLRSRIHQSRWCAVFKDYTRQLAEPEFGLQRHHSV